MKDARVWLVERRAGGLRIWDGILDLVRDGIGLRDAHADKMLAARNATRCECVPAGLGRRRGYDPQRVTMRVSENRPLEQAG
jgi:hypothetical protein